MHVSISVHFVVVLHAVTDASAIHINSYINTSGGQKHCEEHSYNLSLCGIRGFYRWSVVLRLSQFRYGCEAHRGEKHVKVPGCKHAFSASRFAAGLTAAQTFTVSNYKVGSSFCHGHCMVLNIVLDRLVEQIT